jgi:hypothetical protein
MYHLMGSVEKKRVYRDAAASPLHHISPFGSLAVYLGLLQTGPKLFQEKPDPELR